MRRVLLLALVACALCLAGCKQKAPVAQPAGEATPSLSEVTVHTDPVGGTVSIVELNRTLGDGDVVRLGVGRYTVRAAKPGYRPEDVVIDVDGAAPVDVLIPLGAGFGRVQVASDIKGAVAFLDDRELGPVPGGFELPEGAVRFVVRADGYVESVHDVVVVPGETVSLDIAMSAVPTSGPLAVAASDAGAVISVDGKKAGAGRVRLGSVPFGEHKAVAVKQLAPHVRLYGEGVAKVDSAQGASLDIALAEQRRFDGRWLPAGDALRREAKRYRSARVGNPVEVRCALDGAVAARLRGDKSLGAALHGVMRVGDRALFAAPDGEWVFWKRNARPADEYAATLRAFADSRPHAVPFAHEAAARKAAVSLGGNPLAEVALALHSARSRLPLLDLVGGQLGASATVFRSAADGPLAVVAQGGEGLAVGGQAVQAAGGVSVLHVPAADAPLAISWAKRPERLLVAGDAPSPLSRIPAAGAELRIHEKLIVPFGSDSVTHITRLSWVPEGGKWRTQDIEGTSPMGIAIDLGTDEIGPHAKKGSYKRLWIVRYRDEKAQTQRQLGVAYTVGDEVKSGRTDRFFRRSEDEQN